MKCLYCNSNEFIKKFISLNESVEYFICKKCKCHNHTQNIDFDYNENYWDGEIVDPDGNKRNLIAERENKLKNWYGDIPNFINKFDNPKVLDVGCGLGFLLSAVKSKFRTGLETSSFAIKYIKEHFPEIEIITGDTDDLRKIDNKFDIIIAYHVLEHLNDPNKFIKNIKNRLNKSGKIIIGTPIIETFLSNYFNKNYRLYNKSHKIIFNEKTLKKIFEENNLEIIKIEKPFFKTNYFNLTNILRLFNKNKLSPPFYGSIITIYGELK